MSTSSNTDATPHGFARLEVQKDASSLFAAMLVSVHGQHLVAVVHGLMANAPMYAQLFAASPELLEALEESVAFARGVVKAMDQAMPGQAEEARAHLARWESALAKARREPGRA